MYTKLDSYLDRHIGKFLLERDAEERANHKSSGKLSASMLGKPLQWQILKVLGVPGKKIDEYTLRKFQRGKDVEAWLISHIPASEQQKFVEYRDVVGYADVLIDTKDWDFKNGVIPLEIKSVSNAKFKRIVKEGADRSHKLQACLYALALKTEHYGVCYIASDDYRVQTYIYDTAETKAEVDKIIDRFQEQLKLGVPKFEAAEEWQKKIEYSDYPEWMELSEEECQKKYEEIKKQ